MYIDVIHLIYFNQHLLSPPPPPRVTPVCMVTWLTSFTVILLDRAPAVKHIYKNAELRIIQRFENFSQYCNFSFI